MIRVQSKEVCGFICNECNKLVEIIVTFKKGNSPPYFLCRQCLVDALLKIKVHNI